MGMFKYLVLFVILFVVAQPALSSDYITDCNNYLDKGVYDLAVVKGKKAIELHSRNVEAHYCLAESWHRMGEYKLALQQMKVADSLVFDNDYLTLRLALKEINEQQLLKIQNELSLKISNRLGSLYGSLRNYNQAINEFSRSAVFAKELGSKDDQALALTNMASAHSALGEYSKALDDYREALKLTSRDSEVSSLYNNMAVVFGNMGDFTSAEDYFSKSLSLDEKMGDKRSLAMHLLNQGMTKQAQKEYAVAAKIFNRSRQLSREIKAFYWEGASNRAFGDMYRLLGNTKLARDSYAAARINFSSAHAIEDMNNMDSVINELYALQPIAGIEVDSEEVKFFLLASQTDEKGTIKVKDILRQSNANFKISSKDGEALSTEAMDSIVSGVAAAAKVLISERKIDPSLISISLRDLPATASNRDVLIMRIRRETGSSNIIIGNSDVAKYDFNGRVALGKSGDGLLLKLSGDITTMSSLDSKGRVVSAELKQGAFTAVRQQEQNKKATAESMINGSQKAVVKQIIKANPSLLTKKDIYFEGDIARIIAVFTHPDQDGNLVKITVNDLDKFVTAVKKKATPYFNPNLKKIKDSNVQMWAESEIGWVKQNFVPNELMAGVQYLKMLMSQLNAKEAYVTRGGSWAVGRLFESAKLAEKIEGANK